MSMSKWMKRVSLGFAVAATVLSTAGWDWSRPFKGPESRVSTLVITGNYKRPLALAQLMQGENRQPYLLIPAKESGETTIFFCPGGRKTPALEIRYENYNRFINFLNPSQIVIFGDTRYVPEKYEPVLEPKIPTVRITSDDWNKNAAALGSLLKLQNISADYDRITPELDPKAVYAPAEPVQAAAVTPAEKDFPDATAPAADPSNPAVGEVTPVATPTAPVASPTAPVAPVAPDAAK